MVSATAKVSRWHVASRVFAATIPAFVLANTTGIFLALVSPAAQFPAIAFSLVSSFAIYTAIIMWIFSVKRLRTVWLGLLGGIAFTSGGAWLAYVLGGGA
ncbi:MAG: iron transporter [Pseudomonadota bacterium]